MGVRKYVLLIAMGVLVMPQAGYSAKKDCGLSIVGRPMEMMNRGLSQKKIPNLMTDYYTSDQLSAFREEEKTISSNTHAVNRAISRSKIYPAPYTQKAMASIAKRLLKKWPYSNPDYRIYITTELHYGPLTSEDGAILIPAGFLAKAQSEDEVAFVLAHELSHLLLLHAKEAAKDTGVKATLRKLNQHVGSALQIMQNLEDSDGKLLVEGEDRKKFEQLEGRAFSFYEHARRLTTEFVHPSWRKKQEDEADLLAVELMMKAGYSFEGVAQAFDNMEAIEHAACRELKRFSSTMQAFVKDELQTAYNSFIEDKKYNVKDQLFDKAKKISRDKIEKALTRQALPKTHRPYEKRLKYVLQFAERPVLEEVFEAADDREPVSGVVGKLQSSPEYKNLLASAEAAVQTERLLEEGDITAAKGSLTKVSMQSQYGRLLKHQLRRQEGNFGAAVENLSIALRSNTPSLDVFHKSLAYKLGANQLTAAESLVVRGEKQFNDSIHFLPERIYLVQRRTANKEGETHKLLGECVEAARDNMEGPCYAAATGVDANFRDEHAKILGLVNCKAEKDTGGDVICNGEYAYKPKGLGLPKFPGFKKDSEES